MTSSIDSLTGMPMPALASSQGVGARPDPAASAAAQAGATTEGGGFHKLMHLQQRGRELEAKLQAASADTTAGDPSAAAGAQQAASTRDQFRALRELVGDAPGGNARRALAAMVTRLETGGSMQPGDRARIQLAIAADQQQVDLPGALRARAAILSIEDALSKISQQAQDPTLTQDPARMASFQQQGANARAQVGQLEQLIRSGTLDQRSIDAVLAARR